MGALVPYNPNTSINLGGGGGAIDLNALISGGGAFNISGIGNNNLTPAATTSTSNTNTSSSTSKAGSSNTRTTGVSNLNSNKIINKKLLDDKSLQILQDTIAALAGGQGNPLLTAIDKARSTGIVNTQNLITGQDPNEAVARAGGRVSELSRKMQEEAIATLLGSNEASGFGGNALSQLLAQDAAVRTGEAQSRVQEEAYNQAISNQLSGTNVLNQLLGGGSAVQNALMEALNIAKGSIEQGTERTNATTTSDELANTVSSEQSSTTGSEGKTASLVDPIEWAKLAAQLSIAGAQQQTGPSALEKALAIYQGGGGNLNALLSGDSYDVTAFGRLKQMLGV